MPATVATWSSTLSLVEMGSKSVEGEKVLHFGTPAEARRIEVAYVRLIFAMFRRIADVATRSLTRKILELLRIAVSKCPLHVLVYSYCTCMLLPQATLLSTSAMDGLLPCLSSFRVGMFCSDAHYQSKNDRTCVGSGKYEKCLPTRPAWTTQEIELLALLFCGAIQKSSTKRG